MKLTSRQLLWLAFCTTVNVALEISLGTYLHAIKFPLTGSLMAGVNTVIYLVGRSRAPMPGTILMMGFVSSFLRLFYGGFSPAPAVAIFMEALMVETAISLAGLNRLGAVLSGILAGEAALGFGLASFLLFTSRDSAMGFFSMLAQRTNLVLFGIGSLPAMALVIFILHAVIGGIFGLACWQIVSFISRRFSELKA
jgi:hypothetical protein